MGNRPYVWTGEETHDYDDIIHLPHWRSATRPPMPPLDRAAQFTPYDALNGFSDEIAQVRRANDIQFDRGNAGDGAEFDMDG